MPTGLPVITSYSIHYTKLYDDGEIIFPMSATGRVGTIEGVVDEVVMSQEEMIKYQEHLAQEKGT